MLSKILYGVFLIFISLNLIKSEELTEDNWRELLEGQEWMIEFFAPWCPACNRLQPIWSQFTKKAQELNIKVGAVDLTKYPSLSGLFSVTSLPTIYHVKDNEYRVYDGNRDLNDLVEFIVEKKWKDIKPVSGWLSPDSFLMKLVSYLFKMTIYFKDLYTLLTEDYGLPTWLVLTMFVLATILLGLCLGVVLIICIDYICWPRKYVASKDSKENEMPAEDLVDDKKDDEAKVSKVEKKEKTDEKQNENQTLKKRKMRKD